MDIRLLLQRSLDILAAPFYDTQLFLTLTPIYSGWFLSEIFFEHKEKQFSTFFFNGLTMFWICALYAQYLYDNFSLSLSFFAKLAFFIFSFFTGTFIIVNALKGKEVVKYVAQTREISFLIVFVTPFFYDVLKFDLFYLVAGIFLFTIIEVILFILHKIIPQFKGEEKDISQAQQSTQIN